jgi:hypothetical protein
MHGNSSAFAKLKQTEHMIEVGVRQQHRVNGITADIRAVRLQWRKAVDLLPQIW